MNNGMKIAREEIFGPVISAIPFDDVDEVLKHSNQTRYGLASGVGLGTFESSLFGSQD